MKYQLLFLTLAISCESFKLFKRLPQCSEKNEVAGNNENARRVLLRICGIPDKKENLIAASRVIRSADAGSHNCKTKLGGTGFVCNGSLYPIGGIPSNIGMNHGGICLSVAKCKNI